MRPFGRTIFGRYYPFRDKNPPILNRERNKANNQNAPPPSNPLQPINIKRCGDIFNTFGLFCFLTGINQSFAYDFTFEQTFNKLFFSIGFTSVAKKRRLHCFAFLTFPKEIVNVFVFCLAHCFFIVIRIC